MESLTNLENKNSTQANQKDSIKTNRRTAQDHSVFVPMHYEQNYSYPLVVWLHDEGEDATLLPSIMSGLDLRNYVGVAPESLHESVTGGYGWYQVPRSIEDSERTVMNAINDACSRFNIGSNRIFLAGFGTGGTMAYRLAFQQPELFAGVLSFNGPLPNGLAPLSGLKNCRKLPVFWAHCRQDDLFCENRLCDQLKLLHVAGFDLTLRQYPFDHLLHGQMLADANRWMMEIVVEQ